MRIPVLRSLFGHNDTGSSQTDIVMLLTPRIVRTHELTQTDVNPIYIGTQQALGLGGPPPLIAGVDAAAGAPVTPTPATQPAGAPQPVVPPGSGQVPTAPAGSSPIPGTTTQPTQPTPQTPGTPLQPQGAAVPPLPTPADQPPSAVNPPTSTAPAPGTPANAVTGAQIGAGGGQIIVSPPGTEFRVGGGPYTVPVSVTGASMLSGVTLTVTFNPSALRVRAIQEGSFMRSGGANATFTQQVDAASGRIDIAIVRASDATGVAGTGLLGAILFDAIGAGGANFTVTGAASGPRGMPVPLVFAPVGMVTVR
jgi:hypothetical protein